MSEVASQIQSRLEVDDDAKRAWLARSESPPWGPRDRSSAPAAPTPSTGPTAGAAPSSLDRPAVSAAMPTPLMNVSVAEVALQLKPHLLILFYKLLTISHVRMEWEEL